MIAHKNLYTTPLTRLYSSLFDEYDIDVFIKRDDLNHPTIQGNKWHKLKHNLQQAQINKATTLITFGGAYSNHIAATASAAKAYGFKSIGIIRGDELANAPNKWSQTLKTAHQNGMEFQFINRQTYRQKEDANYLRELKMHYPNSYIIPEGGTNELAVLGFEDLVKDLQSQCPGWTHLFCPVGTGGTLSGLIYFANQYLASNTSSVQQPKQIMGIAVLKNADYLHAHINHWQTRLANKLPLSSQKLASACPAVNWHLFTQYHDGGYAKKSELGIKSQQNFEETFNILLDPVYTSKMVFAFYDQLQKKHIPKNSKIILLHTGGLQGR